MFASQLRRRCIALLAMLAVAFGALAPTLAQAVVAGGAAPEGAVMVCTASGMLWVQADGDVLPDEGRSTLADLKKPCTTCPPFGTLQACLTGTSTSPRTWVQIRYP